MKKILENSKKKFPISQPLTGDWESKPLYKSLADNQAAIEQLFENCSDIILRPLSISDKKIPALLIFIKEFTNEDKISNFILKPLTEIDNYLVKEKSEDHLVKTLINENIISAEIEVAKTFGQAIHSILSGNTLLIIDGYKESVQVITRGRKYRSIAEPTTESVLIGPKESFTESLDNNTVLIRDRIITSKLKVELHIVGRVSKTKLNVMYIEGIVIPELVKTIKKKIQNIDIDAIQSSELIIETITNNSKTIFPLIDKSERPDKIAAELLEGKIVIVMEGTPFVMIAPALMVSFLQSSEDYYQNYYFASFIRIIRYILLVLSFLTPGIYLAAITFHQELLPTGLAYSIAEARQGVPIPAFLEVLMMITMFEVLREAGIRLPRHVGQTVSIVGALIIGEAAIAARLVSPATVIVIAVTGIASFTIPSQDFSLCTRLIVFPVIIFGSVLGFYGVMLCCVVLLVHLASLDSFGIPYLSSIAPFASKDMKDTFIRNSWKNMENRPSIIKTNSKRKSEQ